MNGTIRKSLSLSAVASSIMLFAAPVAAAEMIFSYSGSVSSADQPGGRTDIEVGDLVSAQFIFDPETATLGNCLSLGGGSSCSYGGTLSNFSLSIGYYTQQFDQFSATFYVQDNVFGRDGVGFVFHDPDTGPYDSAFSNTQLQGRYSNDALGSRDFNSKIPFGSAEWSLFTSFGSPLGKAHVRGPLTLQISNAAAVPEPKTWAMMLIGIGAIGGAMRSAKRRKKVNISYA